ncbi:alpha/beta-Hydrolase [Glarea lozoyensis ATCC 20868]|uniref:Alpha/beta-Hydrolase n=1 Tax=Glarea lozoyensis (strain ATCC 20868 / MF5171) TaxID=1116229 RepID=S3DCQ4_GLAL2|nr:alpha/beta-Hydrolase [Glarea lozoyensis ATCC 20868]EPE34849.1 alpha/beta-Hydrolase [Glarea lozoyensis ATCC 20868]
MPLVKLQDGKSDWSDIKDVAYFLWKSSEQASLQEAEIQMRRDTCDPNLNVLAFHTGVNVARKAVLVVHGSKVIIAFSGGSDDEIEKNLWTMSKGGNWYDIPFVVRVDGDEVHSFYLEMWNGMKEELLRQLEMNLRRMVEREVVPTHVIVTGFSMGGGVSILAFREILNHIRHQFGSETPSRHHWASEDNLKNLLAHYTFAAMAAGDMNFHTKLNSLYDKHQIRAWDFMHHLDKTRSFHGIAFRSWRGHRYILPDATVGEFRAEFGEHGHSMLGYLKAAEWMLENGTDQAHPEYSY